jgi:Tol biopolymer transport system component
MNEAWFPQGWWGRAGTGRKGAWAAACGYALLLAAACGGASREKRVITEPAGGHGGEAPEVTAGEASTAGDSGRGGEPAGGGAGEGGVGGAPLALPCAVTPENAAGNLALVSLSLTCGAADGDAFFSHLTADARYVTFDSDAGDLTENDLNGKSDAFLFDLQTRTLELVSQHWQEDRPIDGHTWWPIASTDGRYVAFMSHTYELTEQLVPAGIWVYVRDRQTRVNRYYDASYACTYWLDMTPDATTLVADGFSNCQGGLEDGDHDTAVAYQRSTGQTTYLGPDDGSDNYRPSISADGRFMVWGTRPPGTRGQYTARLQHYDREANTLVTLPMAGYSISSTDLSDSGQIVALSLTGEVYRYDVETMELTLLSRNLAGDPGGGLSDSVSISADGRFVVFSSTATALVEDDTNAASDVFLYDAELDSLQRISLTPDGRQADDASRNPSISADGTRVSFVSKARNLLPAATSGNWQVYVLTLPKP